MNLKKLTDEEYEMVRGFFKFNNIPFKGTNSKEEVKHPKKDMGRPKVNYPPMWNSIYARWKNGEFTATQARELLGLRKTTFYKLVKEYECGQMEFGLE